MKTYPSEPSQFVFLYIFSLAEFIYLERKPCLESRKLVEPGKMLNKSEVCACHDTVFKFLPSQVGVEIMYYTVTVYIFSTLNFIMI